MIVWYHWVKCGPDNGSLNDFSKEVILDETGWIHLDLPINRFKDLGGENGADILCGATTATLNVMQSFDVSLYTFVTTTS